MKDYYLFPEEGEPVKIEHQGKWFNIALNNQNIGIIPRFTKENLIKELEQLLEYIKKYGN